MGDAEIPENVKPKVLMYLQKAYSTKTGKDLGVNKKIGIVVKNKHYKHYKKNYPILTIMTY